MTSDSKTEWDLIWERFHEAVALDEAGREDYLRRIEDPAQRAKLEELLAAHQSVDESALPDFESLLGTGDAIAPPDEMTPGEQVGPYEIAERIGAGGMGTVYRALQEAPVRREVAMKVLQSGMVSREVAARFGAERQALAIMNHPSIATIFDAGTTPAGQSYFVMEYVPGSAITDYCDSHKLSFDARLRLFLEVCDGVLHAHQKGIIHRDLKPSNVLVMEDDGEPAPKIIDFGIAKAVDKRLTEDSLHTRVGTLIGTPGYMSPEQAGVVPLDVDIRADVYSLGVLLYELLVGVLPFETTTSAKGLLAIQEAIRDEEPQRPSNRLSKISGDERHEISVNRDTRFPTLTRRLHSDIEWILLKAMDKNRERRYDSVAELSADIRRYLDDLPVVARAPTRRYRAARFVRRHTGGVLAAAAIALMVVGFAVVMTIQTLRLERALEDATLERNRAEQVSDFMVDLFESANPEVSGRGDVTAEEILEEGARQLREELTNQPRLRARLLVTVGESYRVLGGTDNAEVSTELLEQALADLDALDAKNEDKAGALATLGAVYHDTGEYDQAEDYYERALALLEVTDDLSKKADVLANFGTLNADRGNLADAERYGRASLDLLLGFKDPSDPIIARTKQRLSFVLHQLKKRDEAQEMILDSVDILRTNYGAKHPFVATALNYAAIIQGGARDHKGAQASLIEAAEIYRNTHGADHPYIANTLSNLGIQYNHTGDYELAVESQREALRIGMASYAEDHPTVNSFRINLAAILRDVGRLAEAEPLLRRGLAVDRENLAVGSPYLLATLDRVGSTLHELGRHAEAEAYLREAADSRREHLGMSHPDTGVAILNVALNQLAMGDVQEAEQFAQESLELQRALSDSNDPLAQSLAGLGRVRHAQGRTDEAIDLLQQATAMFGPAKKMTFPHIASAGTLLGKLLHEAGNPNGAREAYSVAQAALESETTPVHPDAVRLRIAQTLLRCDATNGIEGDDVIRDTRPLLEQSLGVDNPQLAEIDAAVERCRAYGV